MTARQLIEVMEDKTFIAVVFDGSYTYSGSAGNAKDGRYRGASAEVKNISVGRNEYSATIITVG
jgi:hypothetical protein